MGAAEFVRGRGGPLLLGLELPRAAQGERAAARRFGNVVVVVVVVVVADRERVRGGRGVGEVDGSPRKSARAEPALLLRGWARAEGANPVRRRRRIPRRIDAALLLLEGRGVHRRAGEGSAAPGAVVVQRPRRDRRAEVRRRGGRGGRVGDRAGALGRVAAHDPPVDARRQRAADPRRVGIRREGSRLPRASHHLALDVGVHRFDPAHPGDGHGANLAGLTRARAHGRGSRARDESLFLARLREVRSRGGGERCDLDEASPGSAHASRCRRRRASPATRPGALWVECTDVLGERAGVHELSTALRHPASTKSQTFEKSAS